MTLLSDQTDEDLENSPLALIIEDDLDSATIFAAALQQAGYRTEIILDGSQALKKLTMTNPTVVVLDLHLPHISGRDILQQIRADARLTDTRVILATADALKAQGLRQEADLVLLKPISFQQLRDLATRLHPGKPN